MQELQPCASTSDAELNKWINTLSISTLGTIVDQITSQMNDAIPLPTLSKLKNLCSELKDKVDAFTYLLMTIVKAKKTIKDKRHELELRQKKIFELSTKHYTKGISAKMNTEINAVAIVKNNIANLLSKVDDKEVKCQKFAANVSTLTQNMLEILILLRTKQPLECVTEAIEFCQKLQRSSDDISSLRSHCTGFVLHMNQGDPLIEACVDLSCLR